jgi:hypothetical protein
VPALAASAGCSAGALMRVRMHFSEMGFSIIASAVGHETHDTRAVR